MSSGRPEGVPRLRLSQQAAPSSGSGTSDSEDSVDTPQPDDRALWRVDVNDLDTSMWLSPRDKEEALANLKTVPLRLSDDGVLGLAVLARRASNRRRPRSGSRSRSRSRSGSHSGSRSGSHSGSRSRSGSDASDRPGSGGCRPGSGHKRSSRNLVAEITIQGFHHEKNPYIAEAMALYGLAAGDAIKFINGVFVDCLATFSRLIDEAQDSHEVRREAQIRQPADSRQTVETTLRLGLCPGALPPAAAAAQQQFSRHNSRSNSNSSSNRSRSSSSSARAGCEHQYPVASGLSLDAVSPVAVTATTSAAAAGEKTSSGGAAAAGAAATTTAASPGRRARPRPSGPASVHGLSNVGAASRRAPAPGTPRPKRDPSLAGSGRASRGSRGNRTRSGRSGRSRAGAGAGAEPGAGIDVGPASPEQLSPRLGAPTASSRNLLGLASLGRAAAMPTAVTSCGIAEAAVLLAETSGAASPLPANASIPVPTRRSFSRGSSRAGLPRQQPSFSSSVAAGATSPPHHHKHRSSLSAAAATILARAACSRSSSPAALPENREGVVVLDEALPARRKGRHLGHLRNRSAADFTESQRPDSDSDYCDHGVARMCPRGKSVDAAGPAPARHRRAQSDGVEHIPLTLTSAVGCGASSSPQLTPRLHEQEWQRQKQREMPPRTHHTRTSSNSSNSSSSSSHSVVVEDAGGEDQLDKLFASM